MGIGLNQISVPGALQAPSTQNERPPQLPAEYYAQLQEMNRVKKLVNAYKAAPHSYSEGEAVQLQQLAIGAGIPMEVESTAGARWGKGLLSMLDTATFGILVPNELYAPVNEAERKAVGWGSVAGMINPYGGPFRLAGAAAKGVKGISAFAKGAKSPLVKSILGGFKNPMGVGKVLPGFGGAAAKTAAKTAVKEAPKIGKNFSQGMNSVIKQDKTGFWKVVNAAKTPAAKRAAAKNWIFKNMNKVDRTSKGMAPRVEGWLAKKFPDKVVSKTVTPKPLQLGAGVKPKQLGTGAGKDTIILGAGKTKPPAAKIKTISKRKAKALNKKAKDAEFEDVTGGAVKTKIKEQQKMESIKAKIKGKKKIINSPKITHRKGKARVVRLNASERAFITAKMPPKTVAKMRKYKKGISRDRHLIQWANQAGILT